MIKTFHVCLMNEDYGYKTRTLNGAKNIVICHNETFELADIERIIKTAERIDKGKYGFDVYFRENGELKMLHTRDDAEHVNETVKAKDAPLSHARKIYKPLNKTEQLKMF